MSNQSEVDLAIYYINLDSAVQRRDAMEAAFAGMPWPLVRVGGHDARVDAAGVLALRGLSLKLSPDVAWDPFRYRAFSLAEEGCFASHISALKRFLDDGHAYGLVLEDDAVPAPDLAHVLEEILRDAPNFEVLKLEGHRNSGSRRVLLERQVGRVAIVRSLRPCAGAAAYLVTRPGARKLVANAGRLTTVYDFYLTNPGLTHAHTMHVSPWLITQAGFETQIPVSGKNTRTSRNPAHLLAQAVRRLALRFALWADAWKGGLKPRVRAPWGEGG